MEKKSLTSKKAAPSTKNSKKVDTSKPAASKLVAAKAPPVTPITQHTH